MGSKQETSERWRRLMLATVTIFALCILVGLMLGDVPYFAILGLILAIIFSRPISDRINLMEYPAGTITPFIVSLFSLAGLAVLAVTLLEQATNPVLRWILAVLPILALTATVFFLGRAIASLDDLQRKIQAEGIAVAFGLFFTLVTSYAWLAYVGLPSINWLYAPAAMIPCWVIGKLLVTVRYR